MMTRERKVRVCRCSPRRRIAVGIIQADSKTMSKYVTRQEIATMTELSVDTIRKNETKFGLAACKQQINSKLIRYRRACAVQALAVRGLISV